MRPKQARGRFIAVVGPSGVGKDSVMMALAEMGNFALLRRVITRDPDAGGEDYIPIDLARFEAMEAEGAFALSWRAHGLAYGVPVSVCEQLDKGVDVLVNLSRTVLEEARDKFPGFVTLLLTAPAEVLAARLAGRGRESTEEIARRLERAEFTLASGLPVIEVSNDGPLEQTVVRILDALQAERV
ncbi:MAG: phosphonate metabolism protein/1,5-bisphosphokinase (PRPP-forming) PhnN [Pelagimonas sp.]|nr:phosphonate metabolism protein/1,5-bisphosphokinase (PRPP-forming) PhnN [Pelagimonas sp.]